MLNIVQLAAHLMSLNLTGHVTFPILTLLFFRVVLFFCCYFIVVASKQLTVLLKSALRARQGTFIVTQIRTYNMYVVLLFYISYIVIKCTEF